MQDFTDQELSEIVQKKREELAKYKKKEEKLFIKAPLDKILNKHKKKRKVIPDKRELPKGNFTILPNAFIKAVYTQNFGVNQSKVLWYLVRRTWGWQKKSEFIKITECARQLNIPKSRVSEALSSLKKRGIVTLNRNKTYAIQMDTNLWIDLYIQSAIKKRRNRNKKRRNRNNLFPKCLFEEDFRLPKYTLKERREE